MPRATCVSEDKKIKKDENYVSYIHTYIQAYIYTYTHKYTCITNVHTYIHTYIRTHTNTHTYMHKYVYTYIYTSFHIYSYINTSIHTYWVHIDSPLVLCWNTRNTFWMVCYHPEKNLSFFPIGRSLTYTKYIVDGMLTSIFSFSFLPCWSYLEIHHPQGCNTLQHTATHCNTLQHSATHCNTLQRKHISRRGNRNCEWYFDFFCSYIYDFFKFCLPILKYPKTPPTRMQHTATHCNTKTPSTEKCANKHTCTGTQSRLAQNMHLFAATHCNTLQHTATHCNTLQHTATHCNTLQHTNAPALYCQYVQQKWAGCNML